MRKKTERLVNTLLFAGGAIAMTAFAGWRVNANHPTHSIDYYMEDPVVIETTTETAPPPRTLEIKHLSMDEDDQLLMRIASCEAGNQGVDGIAMVMRVVLNRVDDYRFPDSIEGVIFEDGQFEAINSHYWSDGYIADEAYDALRLVESGWDESEGAIAFCTPAAHNWHSTHLAYIKTVGDHEFYKF